MLKSGQLIAYQICEFSYSYDYNNDDDDNNNNNSNQHAKKIIDVQYPGASGFCYRASEFCS